MSSLQCPFSIVNEQKCPVALCCCTRLKTKTYKAHSYVWMHTHTHTYSQHHICISQQQKRKNTLKYTNCTAFGHRRVKRYIPVRSWVLKIVWNLGQTIIKTIWSIGGLLQQRHHNGTISLFQSKPLNLNEFWLKRHAHKTMWLSGRKTLSRLIPL